MVSSPDKHRPNCAICDNAYFISSKERPRLKEMSSMDRLMRKVEIQPNGCWYWTGALLSTGYPNKLTIDGMALSAHRFSYILHKGPIPDGFHLDHKCHTEDRYCPGGPKCKHRRCVNPNHLEPVTPTENAKRSTLKLVCQKGHIRTPSNTKTRMDGRRECRECITGR